MAKIVPHLWFTMEAEEAARFHASIFSDSRVNRGSSREKAERVGAAILKMVKLDIRTLQAAYDGKA